MRVVIHGPRAVQCRWKSARPNFELSGPRSLPNQLSLHQTSRIYCKNWTHLCLNARSPFTWNISLSMSWVEQPRLLPRYPALHQQSRTYCPTVFTCAVLQEPGGAQVGLSQKYFVQPTVARQTSEVTPQQHNLLQEKRCSPVLCCRLPKRCHACGTTACPQRRGVPSASRL